MKKRRVYMDLERAYVCCKYCPFQTTDIDILDKHTNTSHAKLIQRVSGPPRYCIISANKPASPIKRTTSTIPIRNTNGKLKFSITDGKPSECRYKTVRKGDLKYMNLNKEEVMYRCTDCSYETHRKGDMPKHLLSHCTGVQLYACPECPYKTKRKNDMPKHMLCHKPPEELIIYHCDQCTYTTKRKSDLNKHMITHSNLGAYVCTECRYASKRLNDLNKHMLVHCDRHITGIFKCRKCDYGTDRINKFAKHVLSNCTFVDCCITERNAKMIQELMFHEEDADDVEHVDALVEDVTKMLQGGESSKVIVLSEFFEPETFNEVTNVVEVR